MKIYTANIPGRWVYGTVVVVARGTKTALKMVNKRIAEHGLTYLVVESDLKVYPVDKQQIVYFDEG